MVDGPWRLKSFSTAGNDTFVPNPKYSGAPKPLIAATTTSGSLTGYHTYATYAAQQLPAIWIPNSYEVMAVSKKLHGVAFNPLQTLLPEYWYYTKS